MSDVTWHPVPTCDLCGGKDFAPYLRRAVDDSPLVKCVGCGLVLLSPRPDATGVARWYQQEYFTAAGGVGMGAEYLTNAEGGIRHGTEAFFQFARRVRIRRQKLLEIGGGGGAFLIQARNAGAEVAGLEISSFAAERLREKYGIDVRVGRVEAAPFEAASFDIVTFTDVIEHVLSPTDFLTGIRRLLKPGGLVFGLMPNLDCVAHYGPGWSGFRHHAEHLYYFGKVQLERYVAKCGLRPREVWTWGEPWESSPAGPSTHAPPAGWKTRLRQVPGVMQLVRAGRRLRASFNSADRERVARYRRGQGHDLYFLAEIQ